MSLCVLSIDMIQKGKLNLFLQAFNPIAFVKDPKKPHVPGNLVSVLAVAARNCISIWLTDQDRPIVVFDTIVDRDTLDMSWSSDGLCLYVCSSEGQVAVIEFEMKELATPAEAGAQERALATWGFQRPARGSSSNLGNGMANGQAGTAGRPNVLQPRKKGQSAGNASTNGQNNVLLPIPPPGAPQQITRLPNGKRRIKPTFLGLGGIVAQPLPGREPVTSSMANIAQNETFQGSPFASTSMQQQHGRSPFLQPAFNGGGDVDMIDARMQGVPVTGPSQVRVRYILLTCLSFACLSASCASLNYHGLQQSSLQDMGMPSWGVPQDRAVSHALNSRKRKAAELGDYLDSPGSLTPNRPPGRTLGGDRPAFEPYTGEIAELQPAYLPQKTLTNAIPSEEMRLAVPSVRSYASLKWDLEDDEAEKLEYRNFASERRE